MTDTEMNDRRLPVGIQSFEVIRKDGYLYVAGTDRYVDNSMVCIQLSLADGVLCNVGCHTCGAADNIGLHAL